MQYPATATDESLLFPYQYCFSCHLLRPRAGGASAVFQVICMAPFWFAGGKLGLETVKRVCVWERLEVGLSR